MYNTEPHLKGKVLLFSWCGISLVIHNGTQIVILLFFPKSLSYLKQTNKQTYQQKKSGLRPFYDLSPAYLCPHVLHGCYFSMFDKILQ